MELYQPQSDIPPSLENRLQITSSLLFIASSAMAALTWMKRTPCPLPSLVPLKLALSSQPDINGLNTRLACAELDGRTW